MKASELRIGNYIQNFHTNCDITQVDVECFTGNGYYDGEMCGEGVPLTDAWVLKFGFETTDYENDQIEWGKPGQHTFSFGQYGTPPEENPFVLTYDVGYGEKEIEIKYVHQLQNLYFALTGEELIIT